MPPTLGKKWENGEKNVHKSNPRLDARPMQLPGRRGPERKRAVVGPRDHGETSETSLSSNRGSTKSIGDP